MADYQLVPSKTALVNVDMQNAFVEGTPLSAPGGVALLEPVNRLAAACRAAGIRAIHTLHVTRADGTNLGTMGELIEPVRAGYIKEGSRGPPSCTQVFTSRRTTFCFTSRAMAHLRHGP